MPILFRYIGIAVLSFFLFILPCDVQAIDVIKANNTDNLNQTTSWVGTEVPDSTEIAVWDNTVTGNNTTLLGADLEFQGIRIENPGGLVTIGAGNTLTLGSAGIDMSSATRRLMLQGSVVLSSAQIWDVNNGLLLDSNNNVNNEGIVIDNQGHTLTVQGGGDTDLGAITGSGGIIKNGTGWLRIQSAQTDVYDYTGNVTINSGTVRVGNRGGSLGSGASALTLNGGTLIFVSNFANTDYGRATTVSGDVELLNNNSQNNGATGYTFGTLSMGEHTLTVNRNAGGANAGNITFGATTLTGNGTFEVGDHGTDPAALNQLTLGAVGESGGSHGLTKTGEGTLILTAAGTYTGTTRVEAGTLSLTHGSAVANSGTIRVDAGATLDVASVGTWTVGASQTLMGRGTVVGNTTVAGTLSPGTSPGNITFANDLTLSGTYDWEYGDLTIVQGLLTLQSTWELNVLSGYGLQDRDEDGISVALFTYDTRSFTAPASVTGFGGYQIADVRDDGAGTIWLDNVGWAAVIPEPGTVMLIGLGSFILWLRRRSPASAPLR